MRGGEESEACRLVVVQHTQTYRCSSRRHPLLRTEKGIDAMPGDVGTFSLSLLLLCLPIAHPFPLHHDDATLSAGARNVSCVVLLAHYCGDAVCMDIDQDVAEVQSMARTYQCSVHVVSNGEACPSSIDDVSCTLRPHNLGRECGARDQGCRVAARPG